MDGAEHNETQALDELLARLQGCMDPCPDLLGAIRRIVHTSDAQALARIQFMCDVLFGYLSGSRPGGEAAYGMEMATLMDLVRRTGALEPGPSQHVDMLLNSLRDYVQQTMVPNDDAGAP